MQLYLSLPWKFGKAGQLFQKLLGSLDWVGRQE